MFAKEVYGHRRNRLSNDLKKGVIFLPGNVNSPFNSRSNIYRFRQDSNFLYFFGIDRPNLVGIIDVDNNQDILFGDDVSIEDIIWTGNLEPLSYLADKTGINKVYRAEKLKSFINKALKEKRRIHFLMPYREEISAILTELLQINKTKLKTSISVDLIKAVVNQRSYKQSFEVEEIENTLNNVTAKMFTEAAKNIAPGIPEQQIAGLIEGIAYQGGYGPAFTPIVSIHGEILHNTSYNNSLTKGKLVLIDAGAESNMHYATDITRTYPVDGVFTIRQKEIYQCVLDAQIKAIELIKPGISFKSVYLESAKILLKGLNDIGIVKGNIDEMTNEGIHALFFPHGLGHMMGLDVHDMENLGEDYVGYNEEEKREKQFGISHLRFGRKLEKDFVITVEPGIYFIPALIDKWKKERKGENYIQHSVLEKYLDFGGIRIEDDVLVTANGSMVLGNKIPKTIYEIQKIYKELN